MHGAMGKLVILRIAASKFFHCCNEFPGSLLMYISAIAARVPSPIRKQFTTCSGSLCFISLVASSVSELYQIVSSSWSLVLKNIC